MFTKADYLAHVADETKILKHLATCVPQGQLDYRPTPAQRSTIELMRYIAIGPQAGAIYAATGTWDHWEALEAEAKSITDAATFGKAVDKQKKAIVKAVSKYNDASLRKKIVKDWAGRKMTLGVALTKMVSNPLIAYRMQLFLYAKSSGNAGISTSDLWHGKAAKVKKAAAAK